MKYIITGAFNGLTLALLGIICVIAAKGIPLSTLFESPTERGLLFVSLSVILHAYVSNGE